MRKFIVVLVLIAVFIVVLLSGCSVTNDSKISLSDSDELAMLDEYGVDEVHLLLISIQQKHLPIDIANNLKDSINVSEIVIPVIQGYYDSVEIGDTLDDSFRWGSLFLDSSVGSWDIKIIDKRVIARAE